MPRDQFQRFNCRQDNCTTNPITAAAVGKAGAANGGNANGLGLDAQSAGNFLFHFTDVFLKVGALGFKRNSYMGNFLPFECFEGFFYVDFAVGNAVSCAKLYCNFAENGNSGKRGYSVADGMEDNIAIRAGLKARDAVKNNSCDKAWLGGFRGQKAM